MATYSVSGAGNAAVALWQCDAAAALLAQTTVRRGFGGIEARKREKSRAEGCKSAAMEGSPSSNIAQDDDMVSWLHLDDSSCSQLFGVDRASSSIQQSIPSSGGPVNMQKKRANADAELALAAGRLSPQIGVETFDKPRTVCQTSMRKWPSEVYTPVKEPTSTMALPRSQNADTVNFPQFSISLARARARMHSDAVAADCTNKNYLKNEEATSMESNRSTIDCKSSTSMQQRTDQSLQADTDVSITDPERNCSYDTKYSELDSATATKVHKQATEMDTFTLSSGGSGNVGGDNSEKYGPSSLKRKEREVEDTAGCQGKTTGIGYADTKKPSLGRETTSKRRRAAEVHNLSERRRRDRINERMKALQELIPNSSKTDKASMLDEAIEYLKMLQLQLQVMSMRSGMSMSPIIVPTTMPHLQMPHVTTYGGVGVRLMEVSGHHPHTAVPLNLAATSSSVATTTRVLNGVPSAQLLQGMNMEIYHAHMLPQQQVQHIQEHYQHQQQQLGEDHQS